MDQTLIFATIISAIITILGQLLQRLFPPKKSTTEEATDMSLVLKNITESYDHLLESLTSRISILESVLLQKETEIDINKKQIRGLELQNRQLTLRVDDLTKEVLAITQEKVRAIKQGE